MIDSPQLDGITFGDVRREDIDVLWPHVEAFIDDACSYSSEHLTPAGVRASLDSGDRQLWVAHDGRTVLMALVTEVYDIAETAHRVCLMLAAGGHPQVPWEWIAVQIEAFAAERGCHETRIVGRKGWMRKLPSYRAACVILSKDLTHV